MMQSFFIRTIQTTDTQAELSHGWAHISEGTFSHDVIQQISSQMTEHAEYRIVVVSKTNYYT